MKLIFSNYDSKGNPQYNGGGAAVVHKIASYLAKEHRVVVYCGKYPGARSEEEIDGVVYKRIGLGVIDSRVNQLLFSFCLPIIVLSANFDLWVEIFTPPFSTGLLPLFTKKPIVGMAQILFARDFARQYWGIPFYVVEELGMKLYRHVIVPSAFIAKKIKCMSKNTKSYLLPLGSNLSDFKDVAKYKNKNCLLFVGRIDIRQKGLDILIDSYSRLNPANRKKLYIAGAGNKEDEVKLRNIISKKGLTKEVVLVGYVSGKAKVNLYRRAAVVVVPSRYETFSITSLEAIACGIPLITSDLPELNWIPDKFRNKFRIDNPEALYNMLLQEQRGNLAFSDEKRREMIRFASAYDWINLLPKYKKLILDFCKK